MIQCCVPVSFRLTMGFAADPDFCRILRDFLSSGAAGQPSASAAGGQDSGPGRAVITASAGVWAADAPALGGGSSVEHRRCLLGRPGRYRPLDQMSCSMRPPPSALGTGCAQVALL